VEKVNEQRGDRGYAPLPPVVPHTLRRTYISLMLEAGASLHYVMDQVGHEDSKTTLEIYARVQKRVSRPQVKRAFEELLSRTDVGELGVPGRGSREDVPPNRRTGAVSPQAVTETAAWSTRVVHKRRINPPRMTSNSLIARKKASISRAFSYGHGWFRTTDLSRVKRALSH
jgi:hypothetical protein